MYLAIPTLYSKSTKCTLSKQSVFSFRFSIFQKFWNGISKIKNHAETFVLINCSITNKAIDQSCYTCHCNDRNWKNYSIWLRIEWVVKSIIEISQSVECIFLKSCFIINKAIIPSCYTCHCNDKNWKNYSIWLRIEWAVKSIIEISRSEECIFLKSCFIINKAINQPLHNYHCTYWNWKNWVVWLNIEWATRSYFVLSCWLAGELLNNHSIFQRF